MKASHVLILGVAAIMAMGALAHAQEDPKAKDPNMEALKLDLPDPSFASTPIDYPPDLLELNFKPRPPLYVPKGVQLMSKGKSVTSSDASADPKKLALVTDGDNNFPAKCVLTLKPGKQYVQIDLEKPTALYAVLFWHFFEFERVYHDVIVQVSNDPEFKKDVTTLYNNDMDNSSGFGKGERKEYVEKAEGRLVDAKGTVARYVRLYSKGNNNDEANHYIEVEVFGQPTQ